MYESKHERLAPKKVFYQRIGKNIFLGFFILAIVLMIGILGYRYIVHLDWWLSLLNASMILSGMGPVFPEHFSLTPKATIFASAYALFSGVAFLSIFSIIIAPVVHRLLHSIHIEDNANE